MRIIRKLLFVSFVIFIIFVGVSTYIKLTDGFSIYQMSSSLPACPQYEVELSSDKKLELQKLLDQKFYYLGKGCQSYVFVSEDEKYVVKFFKHKHLRLYPGLENIPMPAKLRYLYDEKILRRKERIRKLFSSCKLAYEKLYDESGLLYIHLNRVPAIEKKITLVDKLGCKHTVDIDSFEYIIQKKAQPLREVFSKCDASEIPQIAQQIIQLVTLRCEKGICDRDRALAQNIAFCDGKMIFIDTGQFYEDERVKQPEAQVKELEKRFAGLRCWTDEKFPQFTAFFNVY